MAWNTPENWDYKEAPGSTKLNSQIRDNLVYLKASLPAGVMMGYAGATAPSQWLLCDGTAVSRTTYGDLFTAIGTTYGVGDGSTTFNLPNRKGKVGVGKDASQAEFDALGETGGAKTHTLSSDEMPVHTHTQNQHRHSFPYKSNDNDTSGSGNNPFAGDDNSTGYTDYQTPTNQNAGGGSAHNNLQPYLVQNYIIKY